MTTIYETGHARNVSAFRHLVSICVGHGTIFNPSKEAIKLTALNAALDNSSNAIMLVVEKLNIYTEAVDAREIIFKSLDQFTTRILRAMQSSNVTDEKIADAKSIIRKIKGQRAPSSRPVQSDSEITEQTETTKKSSSQRSYDNRVENFAKLTDLLSNDPGYAPNEAELKVSALNAMVFDMRAKNTAVINATIALNNARIHRNKILYNKDTGIYYLAADVKAYIAALFGTASPEYKTVSKLKFTKVQ